MGEIVPGLYEAARADTRGPAYKDMSHSISCHTLTKGLWRALDIRGIPARRELHAHGELWHYVVAHTPIGADPKPDDIITDLNPWYFKAREWRTGYLHGPRDEVQEILYQAGCSPEAVALHGVETIVVAHTLQNGRYPDLQQAS